MNYIAYLYNGHVRYQHHSWAISVQQRAVTNEDVVLYFFIALCRWRTAFNF